LEQGKYIPWPLHQPGARQRPPSAFPHSAKLYMCITKPAPQYMNIQVDLNASELKFSTDCLCKGFQSGSTEPILVSNYSGWISDMAPPAPNRSTGNVAYPLPISPPSRPPLYSGSCLLAEHLLKQQVFRHPAVRTLAATACVRTPGRQQLAGTAGVRTAGCQNTCQNSDCLCTRLEALAESASNWTPSFQNTC
jgi:hypothetical protein